MEVDGSLIVQIITPGFYKCPSFTGSEVFTEEAFDKHYGPGKVVADMVDADGNRKVALTSKDIQAPEKLEQLLEDVK